MPLSKLWAGSLVLLAAVSLPLQAASPVKVGSKIDTEGALLGNIILQVDAPRDKCTLSCAINGIHAAFHYLKKNYISGCVMTVPTGW